MQVAVTTFAGTMNQNILYYSPGAPLSIKFTQTTLKTGGGGDYRLNREASNTLGPDENCYVGATNGLVYKLSVNDLLTVIPSCWMSVGLRRKVLGLASNLHDGGLKICA